MKSFLSCQLDTTRSTPTDYSRELMNYSCSPDLLVTKKTKQESFPWSELIGCSRKARELLPLGVIYHLQQGTHTVELLPLSGIYHLQQGTHTVELLPLGGIYHLQQGTYTVELLPLGGIYHFQQGTYTVELLPLGGTHTVELLPLGGIYHLQQGTYTVSARSVPKSYLRTGSKC